MIDDDLKKDEGTLDNEAQKKLSEQPLSSSKSTLPETSEKIRISAWITLAILGSTVLITMYGETMLLPAIRDIIKDFDISYTTSSWILTAYLISGAVATPIAGKLSDIYGRKEMVVIILIIYIIGISAGGLSTNISFLLIARVIQGIGISIFPIAFGIIRDQLPKDKLAIGVGVFSSMFAAGSVVGLAVGGSIINNFGWHATFLSIVPVAIILWVIINRFIHGDNKRVEEVEKEGNLAQADANTKSSIVHSSNQSGVGFNSNGMKSLDVKGAIAFGITMLMVYQTIPILVRSPQPLGFGGDAVSTAMVQLPFMIVILVFAPSSGFIVSKIGNLKPTVAGTIIMTIGFFSLFMSHSTEFMVAINLAIVAAGISLIQVGAFNITMEYTPLKYSGVSLGMSVVLFLIGSSIGPAIAGIYMQTHQELAKGVTTGSFPSAISYNLIFLTSTLVSAISITLVMILRRRIWKSHSRLKRLKMNPSNMKKHARRNKDGKND